MKRYLIIVTLFFFAVSCREKEITAPEKLPPKAVLEKEINTLIVPGVSIGNIRLGQNADELESILGTPDLSDAAMGKAWLTWYSTNSKAINGKYELNIYTTYKDNELKEKIVRQLRVTSPDFKTKTALGTGKPLSEIRTAYAGIQLIGKYKNPHSKADVLLYDSEEEGIAFETENDTCIAVIIHLPKKNVTNEYLSFHPDLIKM